MSFSHLRPFGGLISPRRRRSRTSQPGCKLLSPFRGQRFGRHETQLTGDNPRTRTLDISGSKSTSPSPTPFLTLFSSDHRYLSRMCSVRPSERGRAGNIIPVSLSTCWRLGLAREIPLPLWPRPLSAGIGHLQAKGKNAEFMAPFHLRSRLTELRDCRCRHPQESHTRG